MLKSMLLVALFAPSLLGAQVIDWESLSLARGGALELTEQGSSSTASTVVKLPFAMTLREPAPEHVGFKLRMPVHFSWNKTTLSDIGGEDLAYSLRTLVITPGFEVLIPVGDQWMLRPFAEFGAIAALQLDERAWLGSVGIRASSPWDFPDWRLTAGGQIMYTASWTEDWRRHDDVGSIEAGGGASFPLWFDLLGDRAMGGVFLFPRLYFEDLLLAGPSDAVLEVDRHIELGVSFELPRQPVVLGVKLPAWYGFGYRFSDDYGAWRIYLGFPF